MIKVTIELWPLGHPTGKRHLGTLLIGNDGTGNESKGNYNCKFLRRSDHAKWKECRVEGFPRKRLLVWDLLYRALREIIGDRNERD